MHIGRAFFDLKAPERYCTCCGRDLKQKFRWLELDQRTQTYHDAGTVPAEKSQGWFPFGLSCAQKLMRQHHERSV